MILRKILELGMPASTGICRKQGFKRGRVYNNLYIKFEQDNLTLI